MAASLLEHVVVVIDLDVAGCGMDVASAGCLVEGVLFLGATPELRKTNVRGDHL